MTYTEQEIELNDLGLPWEDFLYEWFAYLPEELQLIHYNDETGPSQKLKKFQKELEDHIYVNHKYHYILQLYKDADEAEPLGVASLLYDALVREFRNFE